MSKRRKADGIAQALGVDDGERGPRREYRQERGEPKEHTLRVRMEGT